VSEWREEALPLAVRQRLGLPQQAVEDLQARQTLRFDGSSSRIELSDIPTTLDLYKSVSGRERDYAVFERRTSASLAALRCPSKTQMARTPASLSSLMTLYQPVTWRCGCGLFAKWKRCVMSVPSLFGPTAVRKRVGYQIGMTHKTTVFPASSRARSGRLLTTCGLQG
jgi:hypothetical protein